MTATADDPRAARSPDAEAVADARATVRRRYGAALAEKASGRFCVANAALAPAVQAHGWNIAESATRTWGSRLTPFVAPSLISFDLDGDAPQLDGTADRRVRILRLREAAFRTMQPVYDEIERLSTRFLSGTPFDMTGSSFAASEPVVLVNQVCWLNRTLRSFGTADTLADVAADPAITRVDIPGPLVPDGTAASVRAVSAVTSLSGGASVGAGVSIGVIDGEVAANHPALAGRVVHRRNFTREGWGNPSAHATAVAGIIAASDDSDGGVAPASTITNYKVLAPGTTAQDFDGYLAIQEALNDDIDVVNCSWGVGASTDGTSRMAVLVDNAWAAGMVVVKSAGNNGPASRSITSPGDAKGVIVVGATDAAGRMVADYSSRGPVAGRPGPHLVAPGGTSEIPLRVAQVGGGFAAAPFAWGTSFAAPHVTGAVAVLLERNPTMSPTDVRDRLVAVCRPIPSVDVAAQGAGVVTLP